ncbi:MAG: bifunctional heptose 7-phosphate kinase/heptose 1-phosphate adenyltransferase, partial [Nitrospiria bacterium]
GKLGIGSSGGGGNVLNNVIGLGGEGTLCTLIGSDDAGEWLRKEIEKKKARLDGLIIESDRPTTKKTRIIAHQQQVVRFDHEKKGAISSKTEKKLLDYLLDQLARTDCLAISDYAKGVLSNKLLSVILPAALDRGIPVVVDPKVGHFSLYKKVTLVTPNNLEASQASGIEIVDEESLLIAGKKLLGQLECESILITRGEHGMSLFEKGGTVTHIPTVARAVYDVTGAGDTVLSTLALSLAAGLPLLAGAKLANIAAGIVVGIVGTAAIEREMLHAAVSS